MLDIDAILRMAASRTATDVHLCEDQPPMVRIDSELIETALEPVRKADLKHSLLALMNDKQREEFIQLGETDFGFSLDKLARIRANVYKQRTKIAAAFRLIPISVPTMEEVGLSPYIKDLIERRQGMLLVTGPTGSGKSTTIASMINHINSIRRCHIVTIEDPIEYIFENKLAKISQRQIGDDTQSFSRALKFVLRQDPDIIFIGEMRDAETIMASITCAETGHFVYSTLHTNDCAQTIDRIIDSFPGYQQNQVRMQLAMLLEVILSQMLIKGAQGGIVPIREVMVATTAVRNIIREGKVQQLYSIMQTSKAGGMVTFDEALFEAFKSGKISFDTAYLYSKNKDEFNRKGGRDKQSLMMK